MLWVRIDYGKSVNYMNFHSSIWTSPTENPKIMKIIFYPTYPHSIYLLDCMLVDGGSGGPSQELRGPPNCRKPALERLARHSLFDRYMKAQLRLAGGRRKLGRNGFSCLPPRISARPARHQLLFPCVQRFCRRVLLPDFCVSRAP